MAIDASELPIVNGALDILGQRVITEAQLITTPDNRSSKLAARSYELQRDMLLRDHRWNFAMKRVTLSVAVTAPDHKYDFAFSLPSDSLRIVEINNTPIYRWGGGSWYEDPDAGKWKVEGQSIITNVSDDLEVLYISRVSTYSEMDPMFVNALQYKCAAEWAVKLSGKASDKESASQMFGSLLREGRAIDGQEGVPDDWRDSADSWAHHR